MYNVRLGNCCQYCRQIGFLRPNSSRHFSPNHLVGVAPRAEVPRPCKTNNLQRLTGLTARIEAKGLSGAVATLFPQTESIPLPMVAAAQERDRLTRIRLGIIQPWEEQS